MKKIDKENSPEWFESWKQDFKNTNGRESHYKNDFSSNDSDGETRRRRLRKQLVEEQGYICCYCMKRITLNASHIEQIFKYTIDGKIHSVQKKPTTNTAQEMITRMGLDSYHLERNRREAIEGSEVFDEAEYSHEDIRDFINYYSNKDNNAYIPYCMAIVDCLKDRLNE